MPRSAAPAPSTSSAYPSGGPVLSTPGGMILDPLRATVVRPDGTIVGDPLYTGPVTATEPIGPVGAADLTGIRDAYVKWIHYPLALVGAPLCGYHGYRRNRSWAWAIGWFLLGGLVPELMLPVAAAQGFAKPKGH